MTYDVVLEDAAKDALPQLDHSIRVRIIQRILRMPSRPDGTSSTESRFSLSKSAGT